MRIPAFVTDTFPSMLVMNPLSRMQMPLIQASSGNCHVFACFADAYTFLRR